MRGAHRRRFASDSLKPPISYPLFVFIVAMRMVKTNNIWHGSPATRRLPGRRPAAPLSAPRPAPLPRTGCPGLLSRPWRPAGAGARTLVAGQGH